MKIGIRITQKKALTLVELMISTMLVGLIMLGVASIDYATKQSQQTTTRRSLVAMQAGAILMDMAKNASVATGTSTNIGINSSHMGAAPWNGPTDLCVRRDIDATGASNNTPWDFADDRWVCYTIASSQMQRCIVAAPAACPLGSGQMIAPIQALNVTITADNTLGVGDFNILITVTTRFTPGAAVDPLNNPETSVSTRVLPSFHSWIGS